MSDQAWRVAPGTTVQLNQNDPGDTGAFGTHKDAERELEADIERLDELQEKLHVDGRFSILLLLQGMDTSGKDGMVRHLSRGLDLVSAEVTSFKAPSSRELAHDFLWRIHQRTPERGQVSIFNRSHYEDVLIVRVHDLVPRAVWEARYEQINAFEELLVQNGTVIVKCFLHISKDEQKERLQARLDDPTKLWKFNPNDLRERAFWDDYQRAYEAVLTRCSTAHAPWHIIPANHKWYRNYAVTHLLVEALAGLDLQLPVPSVDASKIEIR